MNIKHVLDWPVRLLCVAGLILMGSCVEKNNLSKIQIRYAPQGLTISVPVSCEMFEYALEGFIQEKVLTSDQVLSDVNQELGNLKQQDSPETNIDTRIKAYVYYAHGSVDTLCFGQHFNTVYNGKAVQDNPILLQLIKSQIE